MKTEELITSLSQDLRQVEPLPSPARQLVSWLGVTIPVLAAITLIMGPRPDLAGKFGEAGFLISEGLGVVTALVLTTARASPEESRAMVACPPGESAPLKLPSVL